MLNFRKPRVREFGAFTDQRTTYAYWRKRTIERERGRDRKGRKKNEWVLKRDPGIRSLFLSLSLSRWAPLPDLFVPFSRRNEHRTNEIPEIDHRHGTKPCGNKTLARSNSREREIGALAFDFALNTHSGHVDARICKKPPWISFAIRISTLREHVSTLRESQSYNVYGFEEFVRYFYFLYNSHI